MPSQISSSEVKSDQIFSDLIGITCKKPCYLFPLSLKNDQDRQHQISESDPLLQSDQNAATSQDATASQNSAAHQKSVKPYTKRTLSKHRSSKRISDEVQFPQEKLRQLEDKKIEAEKIERMASREKLVNLLDSKKLFDVPIEKWEQHIDEIADQFKT